MFSNTGVNKETTLCDICNSNTGNFYKNVNGYSIYKCNKCGLLWVEGITIQEIVSFYDRTYFNNDSKMGFKNYLSAEESHRKNAKGIIDTVHKIRNLDRLRILDVGCAYGFLLDEAKKLKGCDAYGVEISSHAFEYAKNVLGLNVFNCGLDQCYFEPNFFDVVFLVGTIEHLVSPRAVLGNISRLLKQGGIIVITTLDTDGLMPFYSLKPPEHLFYFNHNNLELLLNDFAYKPLLSKTYFADYQLHDLFHRMREFSSVSLFGLASDIIRKIFPRLSVRIPTNEQIMVAEKVNIR